MECQRAISRFLRAALALSALDAGASSAQAFDRTRDRGPGLPSSMFGIYIQRGELIVYPYYEYYYDNNAEYKPAELGFGLERDFRGRSRAHEGLLFFGYGVSDRLALEVEAAVISAWQERSAQDPSAMPARLEESGLGDVEAQLRWRWRPETDRGAEIFSFFETVFPFQKKKRLIGTQSWEVTAGAGLVRGFTWGTGTVRLAIGYDEGSLEAGEFGVEYLKRVSSWLRVFGAVEGTGDEIELITETQWFLRSNIVLKLNNAIGLTSKAPDWAPEVGLLLSFR